MSNPRTRSYRLVACALVAALVASLVPHQAAHAEAAAHTEAAAHAETAVHATPATAATVAAFQSGGCGEGAAGGCVTINLIFVVCEACDCMYIVEGEDGHKRIVREHWNDCYPA